MMHGYLAFDREDRLLTPFRTWRNTNTSGAMRRLTAGLGHSIPHRWSIAHLYQAILDGEEHIERIGHLTTLAGYVHWQLSGHKVLGVGDASGMFPIDPATGVFHRDMLSTVEQMAAAEGRPLSLAELLPTVLHAGDPAGYLTDAGALLLDPTRTLRPGSPMCPPEGDAGTGMVATNSVAPRTANISAGTSIFAMVVLERELDHVHPEIDVVTTPDGHPVAMVHCNNGASELDAWAGLFAEFATAIDPNATKPDVFRTIMHAALNGDPDAGGITMFNYLSGEPITGLAEGRPLILRTPDSSLTLANFMRAQLYSILATMRMGLDVLRRQEHVRLDTVFAHGGLFTTSGVAHAVLASAIDTPVSASTTAGVGGAWGIAILANYSLTRKPGVSLADYLNEEVFSSIKVETVSPGKSDVEGFNRFMARYIGSLPVEVAAVEHT
jgi:sugar (pentulose or hexulose) kinase